MNTVNYRIAQTGERERSQGLAREAGVVYAHARRAGGINNTLDEVTRINLLQWKGKSFPFLPPAGAGLGGAQNTGSRGLSPCGFSGQRPENPEGLHSFVMFRIRHQRIGCSHGRVGRAAA